MVVAWVDGVRKWIPVRQSWLELAGVFIAFFEQNEVALLGPGMHVMLYVVFCAVECIRKAVRHHPLQTTNSTLSLNLRALFMIRAAGCQREPILLIFFYNCQAWEWQNGLPRLWPGHCSTAGQKPKIL